MMSQLIYGAAVVQHILSHQVSFMNKHIYSSAICPKIQCKIN